MIAEPARAGWWDEAACRGRTSLFYDDNQFSQRLALQVCAHCPVRVECERNVRSVESSYQRSGVVAGFTAEQRRSWDYVQG